MITIIIILIVWLLISQALAWWIAGQNDDDVLDMWISLFLLVPILLLYYLIYIIKNIMHFVFPMWTNDVMADDIML